MTRTKKKTASQLFTFPEIVRNNKNIFSKLYPRQAGEPEPHYICKVFLGEQLRKKSKLDLVISYEHPLPTIFTDSGPRNYIPDIYLEYIDNSDKTIYISDIELNGGVHYKNKIQYNKNKIRREAILNYFNNIYNYLDYKVVFSYIVFNTEDFLFQKFDYFFDIFNIKFLSSGIYPEVDVYEKYLL